MIQLAALLGQVREKAPLIHAITNAVSINDCANILLACGAAPIMADDPEEVEEVTALADGLTLNMGMLHQERVPAMLRAGRKANALGRPVVLDPVGAGVTRLRTETARQLLEEVRFGVIRCNASELRALTLGLGSSRGVDADPEEPPLEGEIRLAGELARRTGAVIAVTGATDVVADGERVCLIHNGHPLLSKVTGTGCMLSVLTAAFAAADPERLFEAACGAVTVMGLCGEIAQARLGPEEGTGSLRVYLLDAVSRLTPEQLEQGGRYELR